MEVVLIVHGVGEAIVDDWLLREATRTHAYPQVAIIIAGQGWVVVDDAAYAFYLVDIQYFYWGIF